MMLRLLHEASHLPQHLALQMQRHSNLCDDGSMVRAKALTSAQRRWRLGNIRVALADKTARKRGKHETCGECKGCFQERTLRRLNPAFCRDCLDGAFLRPRCPSRR